MKVFPSKPHLKQAKKLLTEAERVVAETVIASAPDYWPVIAATGGARKARIALNDRGKRGGAR